MITATNDYTDTSNGLWVMGNMVNSTNNEEDLVQRKLESKLKDMQYLLSERSEELENILNENRKLKGRYENLDQLLKQRTDELESNLSEIHSLKAQQDGDYFLTSLLTSPLNGCFSSSKTINSEIFIRQKKNFKFKKWESEIGGDICVSCDVRLKGRSYVAFLAADAMGKSLQGASGALVMGAVFKAAVTRTQMFPEAQDRFPEVWLRDSFVDLQNVFVSFDGTMLVSAVLGLMDEVTGFLYYVNAEHPALILYRREYAQFIHDSKYMIRKIGMTSNKSQFMIRTFAALPGDVILIGSDGKDDISLGENAFGHMQINENECAFLKHVEDSKGHLETIHSLLKKSGKIIDDLSLLSLKYHGDETVDQSANAVPPGEISKAREYMKAQDFQKALGILEGMMYCYPAAPEPLEALAEVRMKQGDYASASELYLALTELDASRLKNIFNAGYAYKLAGQYETAVEFAERVRLRNPHQVSNLVNLADSLRLQGNFERAKKIVAEIAALKPDHKSLGQLNELLKKSRQKVRF